MGFVLESGACQGSGGVFKIGRPAFEKTTQFTFRYTRNAIVLKEINTALNTRIFCYFGIAICQVLLSYFFFLAVRFYCLVMGEVETRVPYGRRFNSLTPRSNL